MNKLMFKDFLLYNSPCINCKSKINIEILSRDVGVSPTKFGNIANIKCCITSESTDVYLKIGYSDSLSLKVLHKSNIFETNNIHQLMQYFNNHEIVLVSRCDGCFCSIQSSLVQLDTGCFRIKPIYIAVEHIFLQKNNTHCSIMTNYKKDQSHIIMRIDGKETLDVTTVAYPFSKLRNKDVFFKKMKTYITFS